MGLLTSVCKNCYETINYFGVTDVDCKSCGTINTYDDLYHAERCMHIGGKNASENHQERVQRILKNVGDFDSITEWYLDFYNSFFGLKIKRFEFEPRMSKHALKLMCMISWQMRQVKGSEKQSKRLQKKIYEVLLELEGWEEKNKDEEE